MYISKMENYIKISTINDFTFCPRSIYIHNMYNDYDSSLYNTYLQNDGKYVHKSLDIGSYSTSSNILTEYDVYWSEYNVCGKIDIYDITNRKLIERKNNISKLYDGQIFQVYAQYFGLIDEGYDVDEIIIYDYTKKIPYNIALPTEDVEMYNKFISILEQINNYSLSDNFVPNINKCKMCIYKNLCELCLV